MPALRRETSERGSTFVVTVLLLFASLSLTVSALIGARSGLTISTNYQTGLQALLAAEAGAVHAQTVVERFGVIRFDRDIVDRWSEVFGASTRSVPGETDVRYTVTVEDDPVDSTEYMLLTSNGQAPNEAQKSIRVRLRKRNAFSPGAIYLPNPAVTVNFNGNNFLIDGEDHSLTGDVVPGSESVPGIGTLTSAAANEVLDELTSSQEERVVGLGGEASVFRSVGPDMTRLETDIVTDILSQPGIVTNPTLNGNDTFGTTQNPQITHFTGSVTINGTLTGAGILIVDQGLTISGTASFTGLIIVRGNTDIRTTATGNASVIGAIWTSAVLVDVAGSASVTYSSQALDLVANGIGTGELLPEQVHAVAWSEL